MFFCQGQRRRAVRAEKMREMGEVEERERERKTHTHTHTHTRARAHRERENMENTVSTLKDDLYKNYGSRIKS